MEPCLWHCLLWSCGVDHQVSLVAWSPVVLLLSLVRIPRWVSLVARSPASSSASCLSRGTVSRSLSLVTVSRSLALVTVSRSLSRGTVSRSLCGARSLAVSRRAQSLASLAVSRGAQSPAGRRRSCRQVMQTGDDPHFSAFRRALPNVSRLNYPTYATLLVLVVLC